MTLKKLAVLVTFMFAISLVVLPNVFAASPAGNYKTKDDKTGEFKSIMQVYESGGKVYGKILKLLTKPADTICDKCSGNLKNKPLQGATIMWGLSPDGNEWSGGHIMDPENGKVYKCKIWLEGGNLKVRGYIGPFYRTQTWYKTN